MRPVLPFDLDDNSAISDENDDDEIDPLPMQRDASGPFQAGAGVDEVEYVYG